MKYRVTDRLNGDPLTALTTMANTSRSDTVGGEAALVVVAEVVADRADMLDTALPFWLTANVTDVPACIW